MSDTNTCDVLEPAPLSAGSETASLPARIPSPMKLSEAIRLGAAMTAHGTGALYRCWRPGLQEETCALGAAYYAAGILERLTDAERVFPILGRLVVFHGVLGSLKQAIMFWNDTCGLSREEIADKVAEIEKEAAALELVRA